MLTFTASDASARLTMAWIIPTIALPYLFICLLSLIYNRCSSTCHSTDHLRDVNRRTATVNNLGPHRSNHIVGSWMPRYWATLDWAIAASSSEYRWAISASVFDKLIALLNKSMARSRQPLKQRSTEFVQWKEQKCKFNNLIEHTASVAAEKVISWVIIYLWISIVPRVSYANSHLSSTAIALLMSLAASSISCCHCNLKSLWRPFKHDVIKYHYDCLNLIPNLIHKFIQEKNQLHKMKIYIMTTTIYLSTKPDILFKRVQRI